MFVKLFLLFALFLVVFSQEAEQRNDDNTRDVVGDEEEEEEEEEQKVNDEALHWRFPHPDVETGVVFPRYLDSSKSTIYY
jgi:hypothetical protein